MKLYIKQKALSLKDRFTVKDEYNQELYQIEGKYFTFAKQLSVKDSSFQEVIYLKQQLWHLFPHIDVSINHESAFQVIMRWAWFKQKYDIVGLSWTVEGDFWAHKYSIYDHDYQVVATISKALLSWTDYYELDVLKDEHVHESLAIVLAIDIARAATQNKSNT